MLLMSLSSASAWLVLPQCSVALLPAGRGQHVWRALSQPNCAVRRGAVHRMQAHATITTGGRPLRILCADKLEESALASMRAAGHVVISQPDLVGVSLSLSLSVAGLSIAHGHMQH